eukprot:3429905-Amphidinium_carterae.1
MACNLGSRSQASSAAAGGIVAMQPSNVADIVPQDANSQQPALVRYDQKCLQRLYLTNIGSLAVHEAVRTTHATNHCS